MDNLYTSHILNCRLFCAHLSCELGKDPVSFEISMLIAEVCIDITGLVVKT